MARFALGGKLGNPGSPEAAPADPIKLGFHKELYAAAPIP